MASFLGNATRIPQPPHPFYPLEANVIGYLANQWSVLTLLGTFFAGCAVILGTTLALVKGQNPTLPGREQATVLWFILCKSLHGPKVPRGPFELKHTQLAPYTSSSRVQHIPRRMSRMRIAKRNIGYFAVNHKSMPGKQDLFGQLWKEYAFSDSRYMTSDPFVLCMETVTAVRNTVATPWKPADLIAARCAGVLCLSASLS